ncbi:hypothetical protein ACF1G7_18695, partial [Streptomyces libani]
SPPPCGYRMPLVIPQRTTKRQPLRQHEFNLSSRASLQADLANALERNKRLTARVRQLGKPLSETLGEATWKESGLGAPADIDHLQRRTSKLEQQLAEMQGEFEERAEELAAARAANRELTRALNQSARQAEL